MNASDWIAIAGVAVALLTMMGSWYRERLRRERDTSTYLTREEHDRICAERNERIETKLDSIAERIDTGIRDTHSRIDDLYRDLVRAPGRGDG